MPALDPQTVVLATLAMSLVLFVTDALRYDAVAVLVVLVLGATGALSPTEAFAGFASPAVVLVGSMYVFAASVSRAGITDVLCRKLFIGGNNLSEARLAFRVVLVSGLLSSVLSNAAVVATLIPVLGMITRRTGIPASRLLMPLSFGSLMGGMLTLIGTSKNIAVNGVIERAGFEPFGLLDFTLYGSVLLGLGCLYFLGPGRMLLPRSRVDESLSDHYQVPKFVTEVLVGPSSELSDHALADSDIFDRYGIAVLGLVRPDGESTILAPGPYNRVREGDVLILQGDPDSILRMRRELGLKEHSSVKVGEARLVSSDVQLVEAVVPSNSSLVGRTLAEAEFRETTGLNVLAISKHGDVRPMQIARTRMDVGDTLLIQGHTRDIYRQHLNRVLIMLGEHKLPGLGRRAYLTLGLLVAMLALAALPGIHLSIAALGGALGLVLLRCVRPDEVRRSVDWSVLILIGGMLALGTAFSKHGLSERVADWMLQMGGMVDHPVFVLAMLMGTTLLLTQVINHVAAAVIMTPVALALAQQLGMSDRAFLMAVLTGAEFAFMSPVAHQANAMVMGPGDYRYRDFLRAGTPLTLILSVTAVLILPLFWPLS